MAIRTYGDKIVGMAIKRTYDDSCAAAHALDLVGERWALLVVRELLLGPKRFTDLRAGLPHVSPNVLSQRLRELESAGVVRRRTSCLRPRPPGSTSSPSGVRAGAGRYLAGTLGRPLPVETSRRWTEHRFPHPLFPHEVRRARRRGVRGKLRAQARGGPLPRGGGRGALQGRARGRGQP